MTNRNTVTTGPPRGARSSESEAFRAFVAAYASTLLRAAYLLVRDRGAAEDIVQSTLLRTFRRWRRAQADPEAYSQRVMVNLCHDHWRHRRRHPEPETLEPEDLPAAPADPTDQVLQRQALEQAMGTLPTQQREVLILRFFLDLSVTQTAERLGIAEGTVKSSAHRGLAQLRDLLPTPDKETSHADR